MGENMKYCTNVLEYLESSSKNYPDKKAFVDEKNVISFKELETFSKALGCAISNKTDSTIKRPIVILVDNNVFDIIGFMGVLYSGNFYVPIDSNMPKARLNAIIDKLNPILILHHIGKEIDYTSLCIEDNINCEINEELILNIRNEIIDVDPAYIIYTSGSTGIPKGITINHRAVIDLAEWLSDTFEFSNKDILGNQTPFYFDASVKDVYITLKNATTTYILPKKLFMFPIKLIEFLNKNKVNTILWATSAITLVANSKVLDVQKPKYLDKVFFAGEVMYGKVLNVWREKLPDVRYINLYGPTEVTVDCSYYAVNRKFNDDECIPIGNNCRNMEIFLLNENLEQDNIGEICVRGSGVSLGYYNEPEKTNKSFIQNPFNPFYRDIIYKTGDIARVNEFGELVFICRKDGQVKHMGNRIELGEIEANTYALDNVSNAVCLFDNEKDKIILICNGDNLNAEYILTELSRKIPKYMLPNIIKITDNIPYNANGKIDRVKLKEWYFGERSK